MRIPEFDEPEPDVSVVRGTSADYRRRIPTPADVAMLVEVSETTSLQDRGEKRSVYARAGIPVYCIVNLVDRQVEVYTRPTGALPVAEGRQAGAAGAVGVRWSSARTDRRRRLPALIAAQEFPSR